MQECNRRQEGKEIRCWAPKLLSSRIISQDSSDDWNEETLTFAGHLSDENSDDLWIIMFSGRSSLVQQPFQPLPVQQTSTAKCRRSLVVSLLLPFPDHCLDLTSSIILRLSLFGYWTLISTSHRLTTFRGTNRLMFRRARNLGGINININISAFV